MKTMAYDSGNTDYITSVNVVEPTKCLDEIRKASDLLHLCVTSQRKMIDRAHDMVRKRSV